MKIHHLSIEDALESLHSSAAGLSTLEARRRLGEFGPNRVERVRDRSLLSEFLKGFCHFFAVILWIAASLAFVAQWQDPASGIGTLGCAILGVIVINGLFSFWQEYRAERAMAALQQLLPRQVKALRDGAVHQVDAEELVPGDILLLDDGDSIPADCRLIEAFSARVNNATVTGESLPQARDARPSLEEDVLQSKNTVLAGTALVSGQVRALVFATGMHTEFGKIAHLTQSTRQVLSPLQQEIQRLSRLVALIALALGAVFFVIGQMVGLPFWSNFLFAIGIIVANVPEGLLPTVTLALAMGSQRMAKNNALIRHLPSVETLGSATVICTDKTGTLTKNSMEVKKLFLSGRLHAPNEVSTLIDEHRAFFEAAFFCHTLKEVQRETERTLLGDPMEIALVRLSESLAPLSYPRLDEVPFDSERRRLSTVHRSPQGVVLYSKGALETLLPRCTRVLHEGKLQSLDATMRKHFLAAENSLAADGLRILAVAYRPLPEQYDRDHLEEDLILLGLAALEDPPRPEVPGAIARCRDAGIKVIMVTGDHPHTAEAIARQIGLISAASTVDRRARVAIITGDKLRRMSQNQLQLDLDLPNVLFARVGADQKMRIVSALKAKGHVVAVTGDGVNDAPALRMADIGIAMGQSGTDVAKEAADIVLLDDNFASIVAAVEEGRAVFANIRKFLTYILTSNVPELVPYLAFVLFKIPLALTILQILAVDLGTDMLPALALGAEKPEPGTMQQPPRARTKALIDGPLLVRSYLFLGLLEASAAMACFFLVLNGGGWVLGQSLAATDPLYLQATTACLSAIIVMQIANVFLCRSEQGSVFARGWSSNSLVWAGIAAELSLILLIDYTSLGNYLFATAPLGIGVWLFMMPFAAGMLALEEGRKWLARRLLPPVGKHSHGADRRGTGVMRFFLGRWTRKCNCPRAP